jgi:hypothetical protein
MLATLLSAAVTCAAALFLGQGALRLAGAREWSWLAPPVGISVAMIIATLAIHVPGRTATVAAVLGLLTIAVAVWCLRSPTHRPPLAELAAAIPAALLVAIPFLAAGRSGVIGVSLNNDMSAHLLFVEGYVSAAVQAVTPLPIDYPLGPHAIAAVLTNGLGVQSAYAFSGLIAALPVLSAWTALAAVRGSAWLGKAFTATVVGIPFLIAAYYGEAAFKEVMQAMLVLAVALLLAGLGPRLGLGRWVPLALLLAGSVSVYSITGLPWPLAFLAIWVLGTALGRLRSSGVRSLMGSLRRALPALGIGAAVLLVALIPQLTRIYHFIDLRHGTNGTGIPSEDLGNLLGPLPGWEAFGVWSNPDFRFPATDTLTSYVAIGLAVVLALAGAVWALRRRRWMLPLAAAAAMAIWFLSDRSQSPYVSAKALAIASPLLLLLAAMPLVEPGARHKAWRVGAPLLALGLLVAVGASDVRALRISPVGPTAHAGELRSLRDQLAGQPTLFLVDDDFVAWELAGVPVNNVLMGGAERLPTKPRKAWAPGKALDFDSVDAATLNESEWVITTRDAAGSEPPPQLRLVRETPSFALWRRNGRVRERSILAEGAEAGAVLDCDSLQGRALLAAGGVAAVRPRPLAVSVSPLPPGAGGSVDLTLPRGVWDLESTYTSPLPVDVSGAGLDLTLPANLDRAGPRWPIGRVVVHRPRTLTLDLQAADAPLAPDSARIALNVIVATPKAPERVVPIHSACGRYVDWYRSRGER